VGTDIPRWTGDGPLPVYANDWHPEDGLLAPMYSAGGDLLGVLSVDRPRNGKRPGAWTREALEMFSLQASIAIGNARLRAEMQRALARLEKDQQALRASEESFRQAFEYAPSGMAITELHGTARGRLTRVNDALCRMLGRSRASLREHSFLDLVHPDDRGLLERTSTENGRAELRLARRDGGYQWVCLRNSVVADPAEGPTFLLTHVEDIEERKRHELQLAHRASHDALTGLPNGAELRARLARRLCALPPAPAGTAEHDAAGAGSYALDSYSRETVPTAAGPAVHGDLVGQGGGGCGTLTHGYAERGIPGVAVCEGYGAPSPDHVHAVVPGCRETVPEPRSDPPAAARPTPPKGLAVLFCDLDGFKSVNDRFGHGAGDAVLVEVARRLQQAVREGDTVARLGGDEFVVLADSIGSAEAEDLAVRLRGAVQPPMRIAGRVMRVGVSLGIGWAGCGMAIEEVLHQADTRMYDEKRARGGALRGSRGERSHRRAG
jgi:diguanylate cyclase (GGDEF)-like protein/PAS domain S-box-containing protein